MTTTPYRPTIRTQADLEGAWRHLMEPLGFSGHSLWLMFIQPDDRLFPHITQIEEAVAPPTGDEGAALVDVLVQLREEHVRGGRIAFLRSRPGGGGPVADDLAWARSLYAACHVAGLETDVVHLATDEDVVPLPMDVVALAEPA
jgi:hypothetical protein